jgi:hypothetical protein
MVRGRAGARPAPSRLYWICQFAGWSGFAIYVAGSYLIFSSNRDPAVVASMLLFNALVCAAATHVARHWMYARGWHGLNTRRLAPRAAVLALAMAALLAALVAAVDVALDGSADLGRNGILWTFVAFVGAASGWLWIYWMVHWRRRRERTELELTVLAREAQLRSLRAQINPHFLFNCLNSIRSLIPQDPSRAESMVTSLADLLRYSLTADRRQTVTLAEELDIVDQYLDLEKIRFEERLTVERALEPGTLQVPIPSMLVQTLVENAVKHGIASLPRGGVVRIEARLSDGALTLHVINSGSLRADAGGDGFGLRNAIEQLRLLYGDRAALTLAGGDRTTATVTIPV